MNTYKNEVPTLGTIETNGVTSPDCSAIRIQASNSKARQLNPSIIQTNLQYADHVIEANWLAIQNPQPGCDAAQRLELIIKLLRDYRQLQWSQHTLDPIEAIVLAMKERGLRNKDLVDLLGGKNRVSEVLARKRALTLPMIRALHRALDFPLELLIRPCTLGSSSARGADRPRP